MQSISLLKDAAIFRRIQNVFVYLFQTAFAFLNSPQFKRLILKFLNFGNRLPIVLRVIVRVALGLMLIVGGTLGFLPILGFWMFPLGVLMIGTCIPYFYRRIRVWMRRLRNEIRAAEQDKSETEPSQQVSKMSPQAPSPSARELKLARRSRRKIPRHRR